LFNDWQVWEIDYNLTISSNIGIYFMPIRDALCNARLPRSGTKRELAKRRVKEVEFPANVLAYLNVPALRSICQSLGLNQKGKKSELTYAIEGSISEGIRYTGIIRLTDANFKEAIMTNE
jgi:hypothetical protein